MAWLGKDVEIFRVYEGIVQTTRPDLGKLPPKRFESTALHVLTIFSLPDQFRSIIPTNHSS